jgi:hypothetical protein
MGVAQADPCHSNQIPVDIQEGGIAMPRWNITLLKEIFKALARRICFDLNFF